MTIVSVLALQENIQVLHQSLPVFVKPTIFPKVTTQLVLLLYKYRRFN